MDDLIVMGFEISVSEWTIVSFSLGCIVLTQLANQFRLHKLNHVEKFVMSYGGLRGAVAFALVLLIDKNKVPHQPLFVTATISVVYFTVFFQVLFISFSAYSTLLIHSTGCILE